MSRFPTNPEAKQLIERADQNYVTGNRQSAIRLYTDALKVEANCTYALVQRGLALQEERQLDAAMEDYNRAIQSDPEYGPAYYGRGWAKNWRKDYRGELEDAQLGYKLDPQNPLMYLRRVGAALSGLHKYSEALQVYSKIIELVPDEEGNIYNRALCYIGMGEYQSALKDLDRALELDPDWDWALYRRGLVYETLGDLDRAIQDFADAVKFNPKYQPAADAYQSAISKKRNQKFFKGIRNIFGGNKNVE